MDTIAARYLKYMVQVFFDGLTELRKLDGISDDEMETVYALGYNFFVYGKHEAARDIFTSLTDYAPYTAYYWRALGAVNQQLKDYPKAIAAYDMAIANDETDVVSYVYRGESQILSGNVEAGIQNFKQVLQIGTEHPDPKFTIWINRSNLLLDRNTE